LYPYCKGRQVVLIYPYRRIFISN